MAKISKENKLVFCMGDFNVNLLNYNVHTDTNDFLNTMISHYLLPHILHPTCVTDHSATVIDNIFSNNTVYETTSRNIITHLSDPFPQFIVSNKVNIDYKTCSFAKRDFSKFDEHKFVDGFSKKNLDFLDDKNLSLTHRARETPYGARNCLFRIPDIPIWCLCIVALNPGYPHMAFCILQQKTTICSLIG